MVQITPGRKQDFKVRAFADFLDKFEKSFGFKYSAFEIVFLVNRDVMPLFKITDVRGDHIGALNDHGWPADSEIENVRIMGTQYTV